MNDLIRFDTDNQTISARELHEKLKISTRFNDWIERMIAYGFVEGKDFYSNLSKTPDSIGRPAKDYDLTISMAKEICMIQRTPQGKQIREYLISLENAWNTPEMVIARALKMADATIQKLSSNLALLEQKVEQDKPKVEFFDAVADSKTAISMNEVAKVLNIKGYGRNNLFEYLRDKGILDRNNVPYQRYVDAGWFRVIEQHYQKNGEPVVTTKTLVYQKGVDAIRKKLTAQ